MDLLSPPILSRYQFRQYIQPILPLHTYSAHASSGYPSFSILITFSPWEAWIWQSPTFPGSPCSSHAELSFETNSWACVHVYQLGSYLVFLSQLASAPLGVLFAWEHKGSPGARPQTVHIVYTCLSLCQRGASVARSCGSLLWDCSCLSPCVLYLYPSFGGIPTVNSWHLIHAAD